MTRPEPSITLGELGETALIARIRDLLGADRQVARGTVASDGVVLGPGDDAAILRPSPGQDLVVTCDVQVAGRHFLEHKMSARAIGRRAMTVNLSDLAAMGATPRHALVSLGLPAEFLVSQFDALYAGLFDALRGRVSEEEIDARRGLPDAWREPAPMSTDPDFRDLYRAHIVGGNVSAVTNEWFVDITLLGEVSPDRALTRSAARAGDLLLATGRSGLAAAGCALLSRTEVDGVQGSPGLSLSDAERASLIKYVYPTARLEAGRLLAGSEGIGACLDTSDGLLESIRHLCHASGLTAQLLPGPREQLAPSDDYELLFSARPERAEAIRARLMARLGLAVEVVGEFRAGKPAVLGPDGSPVAERGFDHYQR